MKALLVLVAAAAGLFLLDRLLLAIERKGWIYWRKRRGSSGTLGIAMLEAQKLLEPGKRHVVEERRRETGGQQVDGDPSEPDRS